MITIGRLIATLLATAMLLPLTTTAAASAGRQVVKKSVSRSQAQTAFAAPAGYTIVSNSVDNPSGATTGDSVACPSGTKAWGGGVLNTSASTLVNINSSYPNNQGSEWDGYSNNASASDNTMTVYATCANPRTGYQLVGVLINITPGAQTTQSVACPTGLVVTGGGAFAGGVAGVNLNDTYQGPGTAMGWVVDVNNATGSDPGGIVFAVCQSKPAGYRRIATASVGNPAGAQTLATAACPSPTQIISGGVSSNSASLLVDANSVTPQGSTSWNSYENNASNKPATIRAYAICAGT